MGQFSWMTQDTDQQISSTSGHQKPVWMMDDKGNLFAEAAYDGYGVFGGKDYYVLLAEMNDCDPNLAADAKRMAGIDLAFGGKPHKSPNLVSDPNRWKYTWHAPQGDPDQGWAV